MGLALTLEGRPHTIVGVLPSDFSMPMMPEVEIWLGSDRGIPRSFPFPGDITSVRDSHCSSSSDAWPTAPLPRRRADELGAIMARLARDHPDTNEGLGANVVGLHEQVVGRVQAARAAAAAGSDADAGDRLRQRGEPDARTVGRRGRLELSTRVALGASRWRLVRQLLAETMVIAVPGGLLGLVLAVWGLHALVGLAPAALPRVRTSRVDTAVLMFALAVSMATVMVCGLGPALTSARRSMADASRQGPRVAGDRSVRRWHHVMVVGELAIAQVLLVGAGLLLASFLAAQRVELGFAPRGTRRRGPVTGARALPAAASRRTGRRSSASNIEPKRQLVRRGADTPAGHARGARRGGGVHGAARRARRTAACSSRASPLASSAQGPTADFQAVTPDYFRAARDHAGARATVRRQRRRRRIRRS